MKKGEPKKLFHVILNSIADGVFTIDHESRITYMNKAAEQITGFSSKEASGHYCFYNCYADSTFGDSFKGCEKGWKQY